jgi:hypothetical protein
MQRARVLQLLALVEHHDALPARAAMRLAGEVLALTQPERTVRRCEAVALPEGDVEEAR